MNRTNKQLRYRERFGNITSAKRKTVEKMKDSEIEIETKLQLECTQFDLKKLELEMRMKEWAMPHQLRWIEIDS